jgi:predicted GIY-YIG superfamily endonuclease
MNKLIQIYALRLTDGKYYVGQTKYPEERITAHKLGYGALFTQIYEPLEILQCEDYDVTDWRKAMYFENRLTLEYMQKYGWQNVRGGIFFTPDESKLWLLLQSKIQTRFHKIYPRLLDALCSGNNIDT